MCLIFLIYASLAHASLKTWKKEIKHRFEQYKTNDSQIQLWWNTNWIYTRDEFDALHLFCCMWSDSDNDKRAKLPFQMLISHSESLLCCNSRFDISITGFSHIVLHLWIQSTLPWCLQEFRSEELEGVETLNDRSSHQPEFLFVWRIPNGALNSGEGGGKPKLQTHPIDPSHLGMKLNKLHPLSEPEAEWNTDTSSFLLLAVRACETQQEKMFGLLMNGKLLLKKNSCFNFFIRWEKLQQWNSDCGNIFAKCNIVV